MITQLTKALWFPEVLKATEDGLLAYGGDLSAARLALSYRSGIFPWFEEDQPILWWSPDPRMVLYPQNFKVSKSLRRTINSEKFEFTFNKEFASVIKNCASVKRKGQGGTWITPEMETAYLHLHEQGLAISVETWYENTLVGGLYGIALKDKKVFCGESMFSLMSDASKVAFYHLNERLKSQGYKLIDCQVYNSHLESLGAVEITRDKFLNYLE